MQRTHVLTTVIAAAAIVTATALGVIAPSGDARRQPPRAVTSQRDDAAPADGDYLGYVRTRGDGDTVVAVHFVRSVGGVQVGTRPEVLVDAGPLARVFLGDQPSGAWSPYPFRITIRAGAIVALERVDEIVDR